MDDTNDPALALQAVLTTALRMAYYDAMPYFDYKAEVTTRSAIQEQMPVGNMGLIIVLTVMLVHWVLVVVISVVFITMTQFSFLDDAWAAVR
ncbi:hypothetical protein K402DRAFT_394179 [Aulographum hederae CBS 113979]|uniref:Uncharacterized protein n=1 Tax=Aulographum hederae CBS 113979 TaxID=1176131 RepID=A0A6G1GYV0_9PEZI|nr:hypothetical protein K402DRAFT_394179 [Aulographum hederae CBS 113979]